MKTVGTGGAAALEMPLIHRIFRTEFASLRRMVTEVHPHDLARVTAVADHLAFVLDALHMHHTTEDELFWPRLVQRAALDVTKIARMEEQHRQIDVAVVEVRRAALAWSSTPTQVTAARLAEHIGGFVEILEAHLDEEERDVVPLLDQHLTAEEWEEGGRAAFAKFTPAQRWIATGQMVGVASPEEAARMFDKLPPPVRLLWRLVGKRRYRRYMEPILGTAE